jgi:hypothetical protein
VRRRGGRCCARDKAQILEQSNLKTKMMLIDTDNNSQQWILLFLPLKSRLALRTTSKAFKHQIDHLQTTIPALAVDLCALDLTRLETILGVAPSFISIRTIFVTRRQIIPFALIHRFHSNSDCVKNQLFLHRIFRQNPAETTQFTRQLSIPMSDLQWFIHHTQNSSFPDLEMLTCYPMKRKAFVPPDPQANFFAPFERSPLRIIHLGTVQPGTFPEFVHRLRFPERLENLSIQFFPLTGQELLDSLSLLPRLVSYRVSEPFEPQCIKDFVDLLDSMDPNDHPVCLKNLRMTGIFPSSFRDDPRRWETVLRRLVSAVPRVTVGLLRTQWIEIGFRYFETNFLWTPDLGFSFDVRVPVVRLVFPPGRNPLVVVPWLADARRRFVMNEEEIKYSKDWTGDEWAMWATVMVFVSVETERVNAWNVERAVEVACRMKERLGEDGFWKRKRKLEWAGVTIEKVPEDLEGWCIVVDRRYTSKPKKRCVLC